MFDWNGDGKEDLTDSFVDHEVFHDVGGDGGSRFGCLGWLLLGLGLLVVILLSV